MNEQLKQRLSQVVESVIFRDLEAAKEEFHPYLIAKSRAVLFGEACEDEESEDKDKKDDKGDEDKKDKKDKKDEGDEDKKDKKDKKDEGDEQ